MPVIDLLIIMRLIRCARSKGLWEHPFPGVFYFLSCRASILLLFCSVICRWLFSDKLRCRDLVFPGIFPLFVNLGHVFDQPFAKTRTATGHVQLQPCCGSADIGDWFVIIS